MSKIKIGEIFSSFEEFDSEFQNHCQDNFCNFLKTANRSRESKYRDSTITCKQCTTGITNDFLVFSVCISSYHRNCIKGYIPL